MKYNRQDKKLREFFEEGLDAATGVDRRKRPMTSGAGLNSRPFRKDKRNLDSSSSFHQYVQSQAESEIALSEYEK